MHKSYSRRRSRVSRFSSLFVCLFFQTISRKPMQLGSPNLTYKCFTTSLRNPFIWGSKGQRSRSQRLCWSSDRTQYCHCCCGDTGFSLRHLPASTCRWTLGFPRRGFLHSSECRLLIVVALQVRQHAVVILVLTTVCVATRRSRCTSFINVGVDHSRPSAIRRPI